MPLIRQVSEHSAGAPRAVSQKYRDGRQFSRAGVDNHSAARKQPIRLSVLVFFVFGIQLGVSRGREGPKSKKAEVEHTVAVVFV